jgi:hypothetical protein
MLSRTAVKPNAILVESVYALKPPTWDRSKPSLWFSRLANQTFGNVFERLELDVYENK